MLALRLHDVGDIRLEQVSQPTASTGEVVVAVEACGVCGSDLHFIEGTARTARLPITLGHEIAGTVAASNDGAWPEGTAVVAAPGTHCATCPRCVEGRVNLCEQAEVLGIHRDGGIAEAIALPTSLLRTRPSGVDAVSAATAVDAGATAWHAVTRRAAVTAGETVAIIGVGGLGSYAVQIARQLGAGVIAVDTDAGALERSRHLGAGGVVLVDSEASTGRAVKALTSGGVDVAIEFVGRASTVDAAIKSLRPGGRAVAVGVGLEPLSTIPPVLWSNNEYSLTGSYGSLPGDVEEVLAGIEDGSLRPPPTSTVPLAEADAAVKARASGDTGGDRLVIVPH